METAILNPIGRIVAASIQTFESECFNYETSPVLGSLVITADGDPPVYGAVSSIVTQGADPSRPIAPRGTPEDDLATVLSQNPHLPILLRTTFASLVVGYEQAKTVLHILPDLPPRLVARVRICTPSEQAHFVERLDFLEQLVGYGDIGDQVIAAFLRHTSKTQPDPRGFLLDAGRALVRLLAGEPERLAFIVRRLRPEGT